MNITTEDRVWAVISHLASLAFGMGIVLPIVGWADQRRKSNYASFQSLQALGYQSLGFTVWILSYLVIIIASIILLAIFESMTGRAEYPNSVLSPVLIVFLVIVSGFFAIYFLLPIVAAVACALGKDFRYPILGDRLARYLEYNPAQNSEGQSWLSEDHEIRWVAAMGHFSILILIWGMLAPLTAWILHGKHSLFLKFQSVQTLVYQTATTVLYFAALFIYLFGFVMLVMAAEVTGQPDLGSSRGILVIAVFGISLVIAVVLLLLVPLLHILGQWAGYRVLKGENYHYPLIGHMVEKWSSIDTNVEEEIS